MNRRTILIWSFLVCFSFLSNIYCQNNIPPQKRLALVIGNGNYSIGTLANPENDARAMKIALENFGFDVIKHENLDQKGMKQAIDNFGMELQSYDVGLFYYAGHGIQSKGYNYLIPTDAELQSEQQIEYDCVQADRVLALMEGSGTDVNLIILDACRNNPFERSWSRSSTSQGLAFMNAPQGTLIAYATAPGSTASDGSGKNGLYTEAILESIHIPDINIIQMFQNVRSIVSEKSNKEQIPWESTSLTGDFYFESSKSVSQPANYAINYSTEPEKEIESKPEIRQPQLLNVYQEGDKLKGFLNLGSNDKIMINNRYIIYAPITDSVSNKNKELGYLTIEKVMLDTSRGTIMMIEDSIEIITNEYMLKKSYYKKFQSHLCFGGENLYGDIIGFFAVKYFLGEKFERSKLFVETDVGFSAGGYSDGLRYRFFPAINFGYIYASKLSDKLWGSFSLHLPYLKIPRTNNSVQNHIIGFKLDVNYRLFNIFIISDYVKFTSLEHNTNSVRYSFAFGGGISF